MTSIQRKIVATLVAAFGMSFFTPTARADETLRYDWHLRGVLSWIARAKFPTSGSGLLQTAPANGGVQSQLLVNAGGKDYIQYQSVMDGILRTLSSVNGYAF